MHRCDVKAASAYEALTLILYTPHQKHGQLGFLDEPADVEASLLAAWWPAKRDKPLLVFDNKYAQVRSCCCTHMAAPLVSCLSSISSATKTHTDLLGAWLM